MKKCYYLKTCDTCKRILNEINDDSIERQNIKVDKITEHQLEEMKFLSGSYESLFSRRSMQYKELNLKEQTLTEVDYKKYILQHYSFLKRPVFIFDNDIFIGNTKKEIERLKEYTTTGSV
jgi:arsenate reductase